MRRRLAALLALAALSACGTSKPPARDAVARPPPEALLAEARALREQGDASGALERLEAARRDAPADDAVALELADLLLADGRQIDRAAALLHGVRDRGPRWYLLAARFAEVGGDDVAAAMAYRRALEASPDPDARLRYALVLDRLGRGGDAIAQLEQVRAERPDDPLARDRLAARYEEEGRLADAEAELRAAAEAQPERAAGWERLARFYERAGRAADARAARARAREVVPAREERVLRPLLPSRR
jgi:predicted Zn-dependent protease